MSTHSLVLSAHTDCKRPARFAPARYTLLPIALGFLIAAGNARADALDAALQAWLPTIDTNGDRALSRDELDARLSKLPANAEGERAAQSIRMFLRGFSIIDRNRDGALSVSEISAGIDARFMSADRDRNGLLSEREASDGMPMLAKNFKAISLGHRDAVSLQQVRDYLAQTLRQVVSQSSTAR